MALDFTNAAKLKGWSYPPAVDTGWRHMGEVKILLLVMALPFVVLIIYHACTWNKEKTAIIKNGIRADWEYFLSWKWYDFLDEDGELNWFWWLIIMSLFMMTWLL